MKKVKVGVVGVGRGRTMIQFCKLAENAQLVAICDSWEDGLNAAKHDYGEDGIGYYTDYDAFLNHDMDVVMLANYANEHAPFAIKAMEKGKNVISEVLPCQCMKEAVDLIECVERTGMKYFYAENYCFMPAPREMRRLYREGAIGPLEYCEGEYVHNCESGWAGLTRGNQPDHWRNVMFTSFYCTHSMGPLIHISGLRPVSVSGFEIPYGSRMKRMGAVAGTAAIEMVTFENGAKAKSIHGGLDQNSIWYSVYCENGRMESCRESVEGSVGVRQFYIEKHGPNGDYASTEVMKYRPYDDLPEEIKNFGHSGSDYWCLWNCMQSLLGDETADTIDVYEAMDMFLPGLFAFRSMLEGGKPMEIPDLRLQEERDKWRNDTKMSDPKAVQYERIPSHASEMIYR